MDPRRSQTLYDRIRETDLVAAFGGEIPASTELHLLGDVTKPLTRSSRPKRSLATQTIRQKESTHLLVCIAGDPVPGMGAKDFVGDIVDVWEIL